MTRDEAVALMQQQLGFRTDLASTIVTNMKFAQTNLESAPTKPWFLISEDSYADTVSGEQRIAIPTDFLEEIDEATLRYIPDDLTDGEIDLIKGDYDQLRKDYQDTTTGTTAVGEPEAYALLDGYFRIFPTPDDVYRLKMIYYKQDTVLSSDIENNWLKWAPKLLMGETGAMIASSLRDAAALGTFQRWTSEGRVLLFGQNEARKHANMNYQMGGPH